MNANTGKKISGIDLLQQQISKAILTPIGSSVLNRELGSYTTELIDHSGNQENRLKLYSSCVDAILRWVPLFVPTRIQTIDSDIANGEFNIRISGIATANIDNIASGASINLTIPLGAI